MRIAPSVLTLVAFLIASTAHGATLTVPGDFATIQAAVNAAVAGDEILVSPGTYTENVVLATPAKDPLILRSVDGPATTIVQSPVGVTDRAVITLLAGYTSASSIEGFSIRGGVRQTGGPYNPDGAQGGGLEIRSSSPVVRGNWLFENFGYQGGAGIYLYNSNALVERNRIYDNTGGRGIGIRCYSPTNGVYAPIIRNNYIHENKFLLGYQDFGGGVAVYNMGAMVFAGNTVWGNVSALGGGFYVQAGSASIQLLQNIFWNNGTSNLSGVTTAMTSRCDIQNGGGLIGVNGNFSADPLLLAPLTGDFRLDSTSPCIDQGVPVTGLVEDFGGQARDATPDVGADELDVAAPPPTGLLCSAIALDASLSWTNGAAYDSVRILRDSVEVQSLAGSETSYLDLGLLPADYAYEVIGVVGTEESEPAECSVTIDVPAPTGLSCTVGSLEVALAWTNNYSGATAIEVYRNTVLLATLSGTATSHLDQPAPPGNHDYQVVAKLDLLSSSPASCAALVLVPPVTNLVCEASGSSATLAWTNGYAYDSVRILRDGSPEALLPGTATTHATAVLPYGTRNFQVFGVVGALDSSATGCSVSIPVPAPDFQSSQPIANEWNVALAWTNHGTYDEIRLYRAGSQVASLGGTATSHVDPVPAPGVYNYEIEALSGGETSARDATTVEVSYVPPASITQCSIDVDRVGHLAWTLGSPSYEGIVVSINGVPQASLGGSVTSLDTAALPPGTHDFSVRPFIGSYQAAPAACSAESVLPPPTGLSCVPSASSADVLLSWTNGAAYEAVIVLRNGSPVASLGGSATGYTDTVPVPGAYSYEVRGSVGGQPSAGATCAVESTYAPPLAITQCSIDADRVGHLTWTLGSPSYDGIALSIDGVPQTSLGGSATSLTTAVLAPGTHDFSLTPFVGSYQAAPAACSAEAILAPPTAASCVPVASSYDVVLGWSNGAEYDAVVVLRDGSPVASLGGAATNYTDTVPGPGARSWEIRGVLGLAESAGAACNASVSYVPPVAITQCSIGLDRIGQVSWTLGSPDYESIEFLIDGSAAPGTPLGGSATSITTGVLPPGVHTFSVRPVRAGFPAVDATCSAESAFAPPTALSCTPGTSAWVVGLSWTNGTVYDSVLIERDGVVVATLAGALTSHSDAVPGPGSFAYEVYGVLGPDASGRAGCAVSVSHVPPASITACSADEDRRGQIAWSLGAVYERIEIALDGVVTADSPLAGDATSYATDPLAAGVHDFEVRPFIASFAAAPAACSTEVLVLPPAGLTCAPTASSYTIPLAWTNGSAYDAVHVYRDAALVATLAAGTVSHADTVAGPGTFAYEVRGVVADTETAGATCSSVVSYVASPASFACPVSGGTVNLSWELPISYTEIQIVRNSLAIATLAGDATSLSDTVPNSGTYIYEVRGLVAGLPVSGAALCIANVGAPAAVTGLSCTLDAGSVLLAWTNGAADYDSIEILRDDAGLTVLAGGASGYTDASPPAGPVSYEVRAYYGTISSTAGAATCEVGGGTTPSPVGLVCEQPSALGVSLSWTNPVSYSLIQLYRDGVLLAQYPGGFGGVQDTLPSPGTYVYGVVGVLSDVPSAPATCTVEVQVAGALFQRGDSNGDSHFDLSDVIYPLNYLFRGGPVPPCLEASNANGDGALDIADPVWALNYLFLDGPPPPAPFPACGEDPNGLALTCETFEPCGN